MDQWLEKTPLLGDNELREIGNLICEKRKARGWSQNDLAGYMGSDYRVVSIIRRKGLFKSLQTSGEYNWKAYHKHKWLKPFAWAFQIGRYAKKGFQAKRSGTQLKEDFARGRRRTELLQKLNIRTDK